VQKTKFLLLIIIYILFSSEVFGQNLHLKINGDNKTENQVIDSLNYSKIHKDYASILSEIDTIQKKLFKIGYFENQKETKKINDSSYEAKFDLKKRYKTIHIYYNKHLIPSSILKLLSKQVFGTYFVLPIKNIESALHFINSKQTEKGFPFSKLRLKNIIIETPDNLKADLMIDKKEGKRIINAIEIKGYEKFPKSFLKHYLKIKPRQLFDLNRIKIKIERLNNLRFANQIKAPEVLFTKDSTTLYMYMEKLKSNTFDGFLGFGTNEQTKKINLNGYLNLKLTNNLNYGESFSLFYKSNQSEQKMFETNLTLPYILKTPVGMDLQLYIFKQDSTFTTVNQAAKLHYQINTVNKVFTGIKSTESNNLLTPNNTSNIVNYKTNYVTVGYQLIKAQHFNRLFPINASAFVETGFGKRKTLNAQVKQTLFTVDGFKIINLNLKHSLYLRLNATDLISQTYFENEYSRFGGINSMRGFEENSLLATSYALFNTEYRFQISNSIYIHSIFDLAFLDNRITNTNEKLYAYGFGFGILTKTGLFKLNYANGKSENQPFKFSNSKIHISLTADF
tara:strand:+ start:2697 stop:4391 length:1695 start_codon:yes stop_codon:yes gene_type:complete